MISMHHLITCCKAQVKAIKSAKLSNHSSDKCRLLVPNLLLRTKVALNDVPYETPDTKLTHLGAHAQVYVELSSCSRAMNPTNKNSCQCRHTLNRNSRQNSPPTLSLTGNVIVDHSDSPQS